MRDVEIGRIVLRLRGIDAGRARGIAERLGPRLLARLSEGSSAAHGHHAIDAGKVVIDSADPLDGIVEHLAAAVERREGD